MDFFKSLRSWRSCSMRVGGLEARERLVVRERDLVQLLGLIIQFYTIYFFHFLLKYTLISFFMENTAFQHRSNQNSIHYSLFKTQHARSNIITHLQNGTLWNHKGKIPRNTTPHAHSKTFDLDNSKWLERISIYHSPFSGFKANSKTEKQRQCSEHEDFLQKTLQKRKILERVKKKTRKELEVCEKLINWWVPGKSDHRKKCYREKMRPYLIKKGTPAISITNQISQFANLAPNNFLSQSMENSLRSLSGIQQIALQELRRYQEKKKIEKKSRKTHPSIVFGLSQRNSDHVPKFLLKKLQK